MWHIGSRLFKATPEQPFRYATSFRWEDEHCPVSEISRDGFCDTCYKLGISRILILGDSMSSEFHQKLLGLLGFDPLVTIQTELFGRDDNGRHPYDLVCRSHDSFRTVTILYVKRQGCDSGPPNWRRILHCVPLLRNAPIARPLLRIWAHMRSHWSVSRKAFTLCCLGSTVLTPPRLSCFSATPFPEMSGANQTTGTTQIMRQPYS
jgi:hypothetical protein